MFYCIIESAAEIEEEKNKAVSSEKLQTEVVPRKNFEVIGNKKFLNRIKRFVCEAVD